MADITITAAMVQAFRKKTGFPMMECKKALQEAGGDEDQAMEILRKMGRTKMEGRADRSTAAGLITVYSDPEQPVGTMIELRCESAPVTQNDEFKQLAADLAQQLAKGPGAATPEELLAQDSPSQAGKTLLDQMNDLSDRIREVFRLQRIVRVDGVCGAYMHHAGAPSVLVEVEGGTPELAKDVCMHVCAMNPAALSSDDLDPAVVAKEREILTEIARGEGKPENIIEKMVEGRLRNFFAQMCLLDQAFVKEQDKTVGAIAAEGGMKVLSFVRWDFENEEDAE